MLSKNQRKFWKTFDRISVASERAQKRGIPRQVRLHNGNLSNDPRVVKDSWLSFFKSIYAGTTDCSNPAGNLLVSQITPDYDVNHINTDHDPSNELPNPLMPPEELDVTITPEEIDLAISLLGENKSPGLDGITTSILKNEMVKRYLLVLYNYCFDSGLIPSSWDNTLICPIPKNNNDPYSPENYRGIAIQSIILKVFCHILNKRLSSYLEINDLLVEEQYGFRKQRSCADHLFSLSSVTEARMKMKLDTFVCFIDFRKAFDSIPRNHLWDKLQRIGVRGKLLKVIQSMYSNVHYTIKLNDTFTEYFKVDRGVKQGCPLSPTLFNIYINDLAIDLKKCQLGLNIYNDKLSCLLYADDIATCAESVNDLQRLLDILHVWCAKWQLQINTNKTKVIHFRPTQHKLSQFKFHIGSSHIEYTKDYNYLGLSLNEHLTWSNSIALISKKASKAANLLTAKSRAYGNFHYNVFSHLYRTLVLSIISYSSHVWGAKEYQALELVQNNVMRSFIGLGKTAPLVGLMGELNWKPLHWHTKFTTIKFWHHLCDLPIKCMPKKVLLFLAKLNLKDTWYSNVMDVISKLITPNDAPYPAISNPSNFMNTIMYDRSHFLSYTMQLINKLALQDWTLRLDTIDKNSRSGGRLADYRLIKRTPSTDDYIRTGNFDKRRVLAALRCGCLPLEIEKGRLRHPKVDLESRICQLCNCGAIEDSTHFITTCPAFNHIRCNLFAECSLLSPNFYSYPSIQKNHFILTYPNQKISNYIYSMYIHRKSLTHSH